MSDMQPYFSVIVPVYQGQGTIQRALESLVSQSFEDFEVIVVNDGSTDDTASIVSAFAKSDHRFRIVSKENGGRSSARNEGIECSSGKYLMFLDADDMLYPHALGLLHGGTSETCADIALGAFSRSSEQAPMYQERGASEFRSVTSEDSIRLALSFWDNVARIPFPEYGRGVMFRSACGKAIRLKLVRESQIRFKKGLKYCEDALFMYETYKAAATVIASNDCVYHYFANDCSTTNTTSITDEDLSSLSFLVKAMEQYCPLPDEELGLLSSCFARELLTMLGRKPNCSRDRLDEMLSSSSVKKMMVRASGVRLSRSKSGCVFNSAVCRLIALGRYRAAMKLCAIARTVKIR